MAFNAGHSRDITRRICHLSFYEFAKRAWKYVETDEYIDGWHIQCICEHLQALYEHRLPTNRLLINIPPRTGKSLLGMSLFPVWVWIRDRKSKLFTGSHSSDNSTRDAVRSRNLMNGEWFQYHWGDLIQFKSDQNQKTWYENAEGGVRLSFTTGGDTTGSGGNCVGLDDPLDIRDRYSDVVVPQLNEWMGKGLGSRLNNKLIDPMYVIMQRLVENDPSGHILATQRHLWTHLCLPMEFEEERRCITPIFTDPRTKEGEILWQKITPAELEIIKLDQGTDYSGQYQQRPSTLQGNIFKRSWWKYFSKTDGLQFDFKIQSWDTAWETKKENDNSVCITFGVIGNRIYVIDIFVAKMEYVELKQKIFQLCNEHNPIAILVEDAASGKAAIQELTGDTMLPIIAIKVAGGASKDVRARSCTPPILNGQVFLMQEINGLHDFVEELSIFPNGKHDDRVDAFSQGINYIRANFGGSPTISII
jgi:predicted phage terminase large subunit-like protein